MLIIPHKQTHSNQDYYFLLLIYSILPKDSYFGVFEPSHWKRVIIAYVNSKGSAQPAHLCSLGRTYAVCSCIKVVCQREASTKELDMCPNANKTGQWKIDSTESQKSLFLAACLILWENVFLWRAQCRLNWTCTLTCSGQSPCQVLSDLLRIQGCRWLSLLRCAGWSDSSLGTDHNPLKGHANLL